MTIFKMLAATMVSILIVEIIVFNLWLYLSTKNTNLLNKYWLNNFDTSDIKGLSYQQSVLLKSDINNKVANNSFIGFAYLCVDS